MTDNNVIATGAPRHSIEVFFYGGNTLKTEINGEPYKIFDYYIGKQFNIGNGDLNRMALACEVIIDGIKYNHSTHKFLSERAHQKNLDLIAARLIARQNRTRPLVGDILRVEGGFLRFTREWDKTFQTTCNPRENAKSGGFHLTSDGLASYSGSLAAGVDKSLIVNTGETMPAEFWIFNNDYAAAHNGIYFMLDCKVFELRATTTI